ncbi:uncharacterized protein LOC113791002 [Dermatophagoides pteronyssinus]|uniref:uncharacterized protein LOC113791002 n=1 Tax=Dermatophagoides pteronyssinus TaxID=6956 RepID=UPI003F668144
MMGCNIGSLINETSSNQNKQQNSDSIEIKRNDSKQSILTIYSSTMPPITTNSITKKKQQQIIKLQPKSLRKLSGKKQQQQQQQPKQRSSSKSLTILKLPICLLTLKERTQLCNGFVPIQSSTKLLLSAPFSNFNQYTRRLFLTGFAGIIPENLSQYRIGYIIILAKEMQSIIPITKDRSTISAEMHKFLIPENLTASIHPLFHTIVDLIDAKIRENSDKNVVVCCTSGMSRSATIVLAYAIKHLGVTLRLSFHQLQQSRQCARPNLNYFQQLIEYEFECLGKNSVQMIDLDHFKCKFQTSSSSIDGYNENKFLSKSSSLQQQQQQQSIIGQKLPDIYYEQYPELLKYEQNTYQYLKTKSQQQQQQQQSSSTIQNEYTGELRPYIIEQISYLKFLNDLELSRQQLTIFSKEKINSGGSGSKGGRNSRDNVSLEKYKQQ